MGNEKVWQMCMNSSTINYRKVTSQTFGRGPYLKNYWTRWKKHWVWFLKKCKKIKIN